MFASISESNNLIAIDTITRLNYNPSLVLDLKNASKEDHEEMKEISKESLALYNIKTKSKYFHVISPIKRKFQDIII